MTRSRMLDRAEALLNEIPTRGDAARDEFDALMREVEALDADAPRSRPAGSAPGPRSASAPTYGDAGRTAPDPAAPEATPPPTVTGRPRLLIDQIRELIAAGDFPDTGLPCHGQFYGPDACIRLIESRPPATWIDQLQAATNDAEDRAWERRRRDDADRERDAALQAARAGLTPDEDAARRQLLDEARQAAEQRDNPQTEMLVLLRRIADRLDGGR